MFNLLRSHARALALLALGGFIVLMLSYGLHEGIAYTNSEAFCISCHEMRSTVYEEYRQTVHYKNASGVRATCADCHVPKEGLAKYTRKLMAANDLYHHLLGTIETTEKFEAHREVLANRVWDYMEQSDSRECRSCHSFEAMDPHKQSRRAAEKMAKENRKDKTCINCHQGIAHRLPAEEDDD